MESRLNNHVTIMRDNKGKVLGTKRQNPTTKPVIKKPLAVDGKTVFNISELMRKRQSGETLDKIEAKVLDDYLESVRLSKEKLNMMNKNYFENPTKAKMPSKYIMDNPNKKTFAKDSAKTELPPNTIPTASDVYLQQAAKTRKIENQMRTKSTGYRPLDNNPKGGLERWMEKLGELADKKAELTENGSKIADKFAKIMEFCKKYGKSLKA